MFHKFHFFIGFILGLGAALQAQDIAATERDAAVDEAAAQRDEASVQASPIPTEPSLPLELSEVELVELVGYLTAQGGGVATLELDLEDIALLADGLQQGLAGDLNLQDFAPDAIQAAFAQAQGRAEAVQADADTLPVIDAESLQTIGLVMVAQSGLVQLGFGADDAATIAKGFIAGASATEPDAAIEAKMPAFQEFIQARVAAAQAAATAEAEAAAADNIAEELVFFDTLSADAEVQTSESGLRYKVLELGSEPTPTMQDKVLVHYKGTLIDGTQFDSSYDRGEPAEFPLNGVVPGFGEGLTKIGAGGKIILYIPSELGYGNSPRPGGVIQPGDTLIFECELLEINPGS